jgi:hypothetical protein
MRIASCYDTMRGVTVPLRAGFPGRRRHHMKRKIAAAALALAAGLGLGLATSSAPAHAATTSTYYHN